MNRPRVVFDCNCLLQALVSPNGPAAEALRLMELNLIDLQLSRVTLAELQAVLYYPSIRARNQDVTDEDINRFLARMRFRGTMVRQVPHAFNYPRAIQDEPYINLAIAAHANFLVTRDKDLLSLMTGQTLVCKRFRQKTRPLRVVDPVAFLRALGR